MERLASSDVEVEVEKLEYGTASIESAFDEMLCAPEILRIAGEAESNGFDGVFIDCMGDPAVDAAREVADIPIVGPASPSMHIASEIAHSFSVVTVLENVVPLIENLATKAGVDKKLASVRSVDIPVLELEDEEKILDALVSESKETIDRDGAHSIVLGCTGMMGVAEKLRERLEEDGYDVPVIYPVGLAVRYLELLDSLDLAQSKKTYMEPPKKERNLLENLGDK